MNHSISEASEAYRARQRKVDASPKREDFEREFGKDRVKDEGNGDWSLSLHEPTEIRRAHEMQEGQRRLDIERGEQVRAKSDGKRERIVRRDGRLIEVGEETFEHAVRKGARPVGRGRNSVAQHFGFVGSYGRYHQGPAGLWFVWNDGWEPTKLFTRDTNLSDRQPDPDGNVWVRTDGEWETED